MAYINYRVTINFIILITILSLELLSLALTLSNFKSKAITAFLLMLQGQLTFTLYYVVCILGPMELAKTALLRFNIKIGGYLLCMMTGF